MPIISSVIYILASQRNYRKGRANLMASDGRLDGKVAVISGGSRGIGAEMVRTFAAEGAKVMIGDQLQDQGRKLSAELGDRVRFEALDVRSIESWQNVMAATQDAFGAVNILVHSAGVMVVAPIEMATEEQFRIAFEVNVLGCFLGTRAVLDSMKRVGGGSIVVLSSAAGLEGSPGLSAYASSKAANANFARTAAMELGAYGIRVNAIAPGGIDTPMSNQPEFEGFDKNAWYGKLPVPRIGRTEEIARVALLLASDEGSYMTGSVVNVDGGHMAGHSAL
jgi:3alpha(or 20beta)-hydroxysteroid dehydrogenase